MEIGMKRGCYSAILTTFPFSHHFEPSKLFYFKVTIVKDYPHTRGKKWNKVMEEKKKKRKKKKAKRSELKVDPKKKKVKVKKFQSDEKVILDQIVTLKKVSLILCYPFFVRHEPNPS